jgi:ABC-type nitrate/sulfonate/bicarbonate transport system substrate-binding protein
MANLVSFLLTLSCLALPLAAQDCPNGKDTVAVQLSWFSQPHFGGWEVPNMGVAGAPSYASECLRVQVRPGGPDFDPIDELVKNKADVALVEANYLASALESGLNLTIIANYIQRAPLRLLTLEGGQSLQDLEGKNVGVWCCGHAVPIQLMLKQAGVNANFVPQFFTLEQLLDGRIDAASAYVTNEMALAFEIRDPSTNFLRQLEDSTQFSPLDMGVPFMHNAVAVMTEKIPMLKDRLVRLFRVVTNTWVFCSENQLACANAYPRADGHYVWQMREILKSIFPSPPQGLGYTEPWMWDDMSDFMIQEGVLNTKIPSSVVVDNSIILESHKDEPDSEAIALREIPGSVDFCAPYGTDFYTPCDDATFEHNLCPIGSSPSGPENACSECSPGTFSFDAEAQVTASGEAKSCAPQCPARMLTCRTCAAGQLQVAAGQTACQLCARGRFRNDTMAPTACSTCPVGRAATESGSTTCSECSPGLFKSNVTLVECERCPRGTYMSSWGASECTSCPSGMDTLSVGSWTQAECTCAAGQYLAATGACENCPEGMSCAAGSSEAVLQQIAAGQATDGSEYPKLMLGYWSSKGDPLSIFLCISPNACPGGDPESCSENRVDTACALCSDGYFSSQDGSCTKCGDVELSGVLYPWLPLMLGPVLVFGLYRISRDMPEVAWAKWTTALNCVLFLTLLHYQTVGLILGMGLKLPSATANFLGVWESTVDVSTIARPDCMGFKDFTAGMVMKTVLPLHCILTFFIAYLIARVVYMVAGKGLMDANLTFSACMAMVQTFFVSIAFTSLQLFMCYDHPNGQSSLTVAPHVMCGSDEWNGVAGLGIVAILVYVVGLLVAFMYALAVAPAKFHEEGFRKRWKFLFLRTRPGVWWWSVVVLLKGLFLSLARVISSRGIMQACWSFSVMLAYLAGQSFWYPWLHPYANLVDGFAMLSLLLFCALASWFAVHETGLEDMVSKIIMANSLATLALLVYLGGMLLYRNKTTQGAQDAEQVRMALSKKIKESAGMLYLMETTALEDFIRNLSGQDAATLRAGHSVVVAELLGKQPGERPTDLLQRRLVLPKPELIMAKNTIDV